MAPLRSRQVRRILLDPVKNYETTKAAADDEPEVAAVADVSGGTAVEEPTKAVASDESATEEPSEAAAAGGLELTRGLGFGQ